MDFNAHSNYDWKKQICLNFFVYGGLWETLYKITVKDAMELIKKLVSMFRNVIQDVIELLLVNSWVVLCQAKQGNSTVDF